MAAHSAAGPQPYLPLQHSNHPTRCPGWPLIAPPDIDCCPPQPSIMQPKSSRMLQSALFGPRMGDSAVPSPYCSPTMDKATKQPSLVPDPAFNAIGSKSTASTGDDASNSSGSRTATGNPPSQQHPQASNPVRLAPKPGYVFDNGLNMTDAPSSSRNLSRAVVAQPTHRSPSAFDIREGKSNNTIELVSPKPDPSMHVYSPSTPKPTNPQAGAAHSAPLMKEEWLLIAPFIPSSVG
ncbi:hypothetical protein BDZ89DRAFT_1155263 [Hymenopellis radicata]|nr:hypothetical protein BDZ89DRAFT_1155263 [Hymenopellis radicata]